MRCYICNKDGAEHLDKRDMKYFCESCHEDIRQILFEQEEEEEHGYVPQIEKS